MIAAFAKVGKGRGSSLHCWKIKEKGIYFIKKGRGRWIGKEKNLSRPTDLETLPPSRRGGSRQTTGREKGRESSSFSRLQRSSFYLKERGTANRMVGRGGKISFRRKRLISNSRKGRRSSFSRRKKRKPLPLRREGSLTRHIVGEFSFSLVRKEGEVLLVRPQRPHALFLWGGKKEQEGSACPRARLGEGEETSHLFDKRRKEGLFLLVKGT